MTTAVDIPHQVAVIVAAVAERPVGELAMESQLVEDLGLDSLQVVEIAVRAEEQFQAPVDDSLLAAPDITVAECARVVQEAVAQAVLT